jgi:molybdopterin molybdotransferase
MTTSLMPIEQALRLVLAQVQALPAEIVALDDAWDRVLAEAAFADQDQPAFDRSAMDGVAVRADDVREPGTLVLLVGEAAAGTPFAGELVAGTCVRIMTGAVLPAGATAVVPIERIETAEVEGKPAFRLLDLVRPEQHVSRRGSEVRAGDIVVTSGSRLTGARVGVLATFGHAHVAVTRRPVVAMLPTGNEIVPVDHAPLPGQVRDANRHALTGLLRAAGAHVLQRPVAADRREALAQDIESAWEVADVVVLSGGVSAGDYDFVAPALQDVGATCHVHQIRIKPGKPFLFATRQRPGRAGVQLAFGLPGNPISSYVCCALFVLPALAALQGELTPAWQHVQVPTRTRLPAVGPRTELLPARLVQDGGRTQVEVLSVRGSADLAHFAVATWLVVRQAGATEAEAGSLVDLLVWPRP